MAVVRMVDRAWGNHGRRRTSNDEWYAAIRHPGALVGESVVR